MSNPALAHTWTCEPIGAQPHDLFPTSSDESIEITDDMLIDIGEVVPPPCPPDAFRP